jgi:predicted  nucleic acid-binding Zn-ribbon protein
MKFLAMWKNLGTSTEKIQREDLAKIIHHRNHLERSLDEAWREYIDMKRRSDIRTVAHQKSVASLSADIEKGKQEFQELSECTEQLIEETRQLQSVISQRGKDISRMSAELKDKTVHAKQMTNHVAELQSELSTVTKTLKAQEELLDEMKAKSTKDSLSQERDNSQRAVIHLTSLISGQMAYIERTLATLIAPSRPTSQQDLRKDLSNVTKRRSFQRSPSPQTPLSPASHMRKISAMRNGGEGSSTGERPLRRQSSLHLTAEPESFEDKVRIISETVRKINNQCFQAIEDLAATRDSKRTSETSSSNSSDDEGRLSSIRTPDLDSRAETALSGSVASIANTVVDDADGVSSGHIRIQSIVEEIESDVDGERFVDAAQVVVEEEEKK